MQKTSKLGLSAGQPKILQFLFTHNGCEQKEIAKNYNLEPASVTSLVAGMEKANLIIRKQTNEDRRSLHVYLTPKGEKITKKVLEIFDEVTKEAFQDFTTEEKSEMLRLHTKMFNNLLN